MRLVLYYQYCLNERVSNMYNIKAVSKILDMPAVTIRSWENRYQAVQPQRTASGHRDYSDQDIEVLKLIKKHVREKGLKVSQAVKLVLQQQESLSQKTIELNGVSSICPNIYEEHINEIYDAVINGYAEECNRLLDFFFSQYHYNVVFFSIIAPLMQRVGDEWERGNIGVAHEHMVSNHIIYQRFMHFFREFPISPKKPKALTFCPSGEKHYFGILLFALFLRENGFEVIYLGPDTPLDGLNEIIEQQKIKLVCLSISNPDLLSTVKHYMAEIEQYHSDIQFVVGGRGVIDYFTEANKCYLTANYLDWKKWLDEQTIIW